MRYGELTVQLSALNNAYVYEKYGWGLAGLCLHAIKAIFKRTTGSRLGFCGRRFRGYPYGIQVIAHDCTSTRRAEVHIQCTVGVRKNWKITCQKKEAYVSAAFLRQLGVEPERDVYFWVEFKIPK